MPITAKRTRPDTIYLDIRPFRTLNTGQIFHTLGQRQLHVRIGLLKSDRRGVSLRRIMIINFECEC